MVNTAEFNELIDEINNLYSETVPDPDKVGAKSAELWLIKREARLTVLMCDYLRRFL